MGAIKAWLRRLEAAGRGETLTLVCPECGDEFRVDAEVGLPYLTHWWTRLEGGDPEPTDPDVILLNAHEHPASFFVDKASGEGWMGTLFEGIENTPTAPETEDLSEV